MLSLDVFSVVLLKRHGIYMFFEAFSTVRASFWEVLLGPFLAHFRGGLLGASLGSFWASF